MKYYVDLSHLMTTSW